MALLEVLVAAVHLDNPLILISLRAIRDTVLAQFRALQPRQSHHHHQATLYFPPLVSVSASECKWSSLAGVGFLKFLSRAPANDFSRANSPTKSHNSESVHSPGLGKYIHLY